MAEYKKSGKDDPLKHISAIMADIVKEFDFSKVETYNSLQLIWEDICEKRFRERTQVINKTDDGVLHIACESAMISNELFMQKKELIKKIPKSFGITNIIFSHKSWKQHKE